MSIPGVLRNRLVWLIRLISTCCRRITEFVRYGRAGAPRIGELPYVRVKEERQPFINQAPGPSTPPLQASFQNQAFHQPSPPPQHQQDSWGTWDDRTFGIETKIAEYRQQVQQQKNSIAPNNHQQKQESPDPPDDLFSDLQPTLKAAKTYRVHDPNAKVVQQAPRQSLFEVKEMDPFANRQFSTELGELDFNATAASNIASTSWDADDVQLPDLDQALNDQKKREVAERQQKRREEHERRLREKQGKNH